ncbi:lactate utilization protein C [mine drainage metagenome]|uniref:Lactate utilization protein C n=1 Tax=mine drainage metagenome TaxID=410659 RepID=A0A1J5SXB5_9ZZZZ
MNSREKILAYIEKNKPAIVSLPDLKNLFITGNENVVKKFSEVLESISSTVKKINGWQDILDEISLLKNNGNYVLNAVEEISNDREIIIKKTKDELEKLDYAFIKGEIAVAENGAVWLTDKNMTNRLLPFICRHLCLIVESKNIVHNMHEAYEKIKINETGFGVFISGPSKTADIEQSLVIGAHGALDLTVYIIQ